jgi:hypothetical protein
LVVVFADRLRRADAIAPALDPPASPVRRMIATRTVWLWILIVLHALLACVTFAVGNPLGLYFVLFVVVALLRISTHRTRAKAPLVRDAVIVLDAFSVGRKYPTHHVRVKNGVGVERQLEVLHAPQEIAKGDVGVLFSRADMVWGFHEID